MRLWYLQLPSPKYVFLEMMLGIGSDADHQYGDPLLDQLDIHNVVHHRLFRESCYNHQGNYVKVCTHFAHEAL